MADQEGAGPAGSQTAPPQLWEASRYEVFRSSFSASEQQQLLHDDTDAQTKVCMILTALIVIGVLLAAISVLLITFVIL